MVRSLHTAAVPRPRRINWQHTCSTLHLDGDSSIGCMRWTPVLCVRCMLPGPTGR